jgi:ankyrin repeat protein
MGNNINKPINKYKETILISSIKNGDFNQVDELLNEPNIDVNKQDIFGYSPIILAVLGGNTDLLNKLLKKKVNINIKRISNDKYVKSTEDTPLIITCKYTNPSHLTNLKILLNQKELNVNDVDIYGRTALITSVFTDNLQGLKEILKDKKVLINKQDKKGKNAIMYAVEYNNIDIIKELLKNEKIDLDLKDNKNKNVFNFVNNDKIKNLLLNFSIIKSKKNLPFSVKTEIDKYL